MARPSTVPDSHWMALLNVADKAAVKGTAVFTRAVMTARNQGLDPRIQANLMRAIQSGNAQAVVDSLPWEPFWQSQFDGYQAIFQDVIAQAANAALPNINQVRESTWRQDTLRKRRRFAKKGAKKELVQVFGSQAMAQNALADMKAGEDDPNVDYVLEEKKNDQGETFWGLYKVTSEPKETGKPKTAGTFNRIRYKFDRTNPDAVAWAKVHAGELITQPADKAAIKKLVVQALEQGVDSKTYAKQVLQYIGMGSQQVASLNKWMKDQSKKLKPGQTIDPAKHQKKVDQLLRKRSQFIALNEALVAAKQGNEIAVQAALKSGDLQEGRYLKEWVLTPDDKLCPICAAQRDADGELLTVPVGEPWPLKAKGTTIGMIPHAHPRCRCAQALVENPAWIPTAGPEITGLISAMPAWLPPSFGEYGPVPDQVQPIDLTAFETLTNPTDVVAFVKALNKALKGFVDNVEVIKGQYDLDPVYDPATKTLKVTVSPNSTNYIYNLRHDGVAALNHYQTRIALQKLLTTIVRSKLPFQGSLDYLADKVRTQMVNLEVAKALSTVFGKPGQAALDAIHTYIRSVQLEGMNSLLGPNVNILGQFWAAKTPDDFVKLVETTNQMFIEDFLTGAAKTGLLTPLEALKVKWYVMNEPGGAKNYLAWFSMYSQSAEHLVRLMGDVNMKLAEGDSWPKGSQDSKDLLKLLKWGFGAATTKIKPPPDVLATLPKPPKVKGPAKPKAAAVELQVGDIIPLKGLKLSGAKLVNQSGQTLAVPHNAKGKVVVLGKGKKAFIPVIDKTTGQILQKMPVQGGAIDLGNGISLHVIKDPTWQKTKGYYIVPSQGVHWDYGPTYGKPQGLGSPIKLQWNQHGQLVFKGTPLDIELPSFVPKIKGTTGTPMGKPAGAAPAQPTPMAAKPKQSIYSQHSDANAAFAAASLAMEQGDFVHSVQQNPQTGQYEVIVHLDAPITGFYNQKQTALDKAEIKATTTGKKFSVYYDPHTNTWAVVDMMSVTTYHPNGTPIVDEYQPTALGNKTPILPKATPTVVPKPAPAAPPPPAKPVAPTSTADFAAVDAAWAAKAADPAAHFKFEREARDLGGAHSKYLYRDAQGNQWLFKPVHEAFRATGEELAYKVSRLVNPKSVEVRVIKLDGKLGTIQPMLPDVVVGGYKKRSLVNLEPAEYRAIFAEHVIDWLIGNHDGHADNFLRTKDGTVYGIDKGQVYKFIGQDKLDGIYNPNAGFETPIYNQLRDLIKTGKLSPVDIDLTDAIAAVRRAAAISDADLMALARPYVEGRTQNPNERTRIMNAIVARKQNIIADFERYWSDVMGKKITVGTSTPAPAATAKPKVTAKPSPDAIVPGWTTAHDAIIADVTATGWQGKSVDFDGGLVENHAALVWQEIGPGGKPRTVIDMKFRADVRMPNGKTMAQVLDAEIKRVAPQGKAQAPTRAMAGDRMPDDLTLAAFDKVVAAYKTTKTHATDLAFNQATLDALTQVVADLKATLVQVKGQFHPPPGKDQDYLDMVAYYNDAAQHIAQRVADLKAGKVPPALPSHLVSPDGKLKPYVRQRDEPLAPKPAAPVAAPIKSAVYDTHFVHRTLDKNGNLSVVSERASLSHLTRDWNQTVSDEGSWKLDLGDGVKAIWYGQGPGVSHFVRQGQFTLTIEGEATPARVQAALKKLETLGMDPKSVRMSTPEDREVAYLIRHGATNKLTDPTWSALMARSKAGEDAATLLPDMRDYWSKRMRVPDVTKLPNYEPDGGYEPAIVDRRIGGGWVVHKRFDLDATDAMKGYRLYLGLTGGMNVETLFQSMLEYQTLGMLATSERIRIGLFAGKGGMSPNSDMGTGGGNYVFTRITRGTSKNVVFRNTLFERLDRRSYSSDSFGATDPNDSRSRGVLATPAEWQRAASNGDNETLFLGVVSILDHIDVIHAGSPSARQRIIGMMRSRGIDQFPDGRKLEQVIQE